MLDAKKSFNRSAITLISHFQHQSIEKTTFANTRKNGKNSLAAATQVMAPLQGPNREKK
jgi:hypothetical protein